MLVLSLGCAYYVIAHKTSTRNAFPSFPATPEGNQTLVHTEPTRRLYLDLNIHLTVGLWSFQARDWRDLICRFPLNLIGGLY